MRKEILKWIEENTIFDVIKETNNGLKSYLLYSSIYDLEIHIHYSKILNTYYIDITEEYEGLRNFKKALKEF